MEETIISSSNLNDSQEDVIVSCIGLSECQHQSTVKLIWGPPGTGKTKTGGLLLFSLLKLKCRTLTCAPTNIAVLQVLGYFQNSNTHKFTWFGNLPTPRSYCLVLITQRNNTNKGGGENSSRLNSTHTSSLCCSHFSSVLSVFFLHSHTQLFTELICIQDGSKGA
ncbi:hypothetical protein BDE02_17G120400 [Populus trichocarpa]|nr:hypothetical protein BDE02_17G120400 [Populus trichocarpa]